MAMISSLTVFFFTTVVHATVPSNSRGRAAAISQEQKGPGEMVVLRPLFNGVAPGTIEQKGTPRTETTSSSTYPNSKSKAEVQSSPDWLPSPLSPEDQDLAQAASQLLLALKEMRQALAEYTDRTETLDAKHSDTVPLLPSDITTRLIDALAELDEETAHYASLKTVQSYTQEDALESIRGSLLHEALFVIDPELAAYFEEVMVRYVVTLTERSSESEYSDVL